MADVKEIISLFYEKHQKPSVIADKVGVKRPYITKTIKKDNRYTEEKLLARNTNKQNQRVRNKLAMRKRREEQKMLLDNMKLKHRQATVELSHYSKYY